MLRQSPETGCTAQQARRNQLSVEWCIIEPGGLEAATMPAVKIRASQQALRQERRTSNESACACKAVRVLELCRAQGNRLSVCLPRCRGRRAGHAAGVQPPEGCKGPQQASKAHSSLSGSLVPSLDHAVVSSPAKQACQTWLQSCFPMTIIPSYMFSFALPGPSLCLALIWKMRWSATCSVCVTHR